MADYYTKFSLVVRLPDLSAQEYALDLARQAHGAHLGDGLPAGFPEALADLPEEWSFSTEADHSTGEPGVWLHSEEGGVEAACAFIQHLLGHFGLAEPVGFAWSHDCSKPRTDAYGGGAALVSARELKTIDTGAWLARQAAALAEPARRGRPR